MCFISVIYILIEYILPFNLLLSMYKIIRRICIACVFVICTSVLSHADSGSVEVQEFSVSDGVFTTEFTVNGVTHNYTSPANTKLLSIFFSNYSWNDSRTIQWWFFDGQVYYFVIPTFLAYVYDESTQSKKLLQYNPVTDNVSTLNVTLYNSAQSGYLRGSSTSTYFTIWDSGLNNHYMYILHPINFDINTWNSYSLTTAFVDNLIYFWTSNGSSSSSYNYTGVIGDMVLEDAGAYTYIKSYGEILSSPIALSQSFQSPDPLGTWAVPEEPLEHGASVGKFQSGSGIILRASTLDSNPEDLELHVEVYQSGSLVASGSNFFNATWEGEVLISWLGAWNYYWTAKSVSSTNPSIQSEVTEFWGSLGEQATDFEIYEWFEPYPYGYRFGNALVTNKYNILNWWTRDRIDSEFPYYHIDYLPWNKWDIFDNAFNTSLNSWFETGSLKSLFAFEFLGLNTSSPSVFAGGSCYGMAISAAMNYLHDDYLNEHYQSIFMLIQDKDVWKSIPSPSSIKDVDSFTYWDEYDDTVLKSILSFQLSQHSSLNSWLRRLWEDDPLSIYDKLKDRSGNVHILTFSWKWRDGTHQSHAVIPYKLDEINGEKRIYVWDNNVAYPYLESETGNVAALAMDQYLVIKDDNTFESPLYSFWSSFDTMSIMDITDIYDSNKKSTPKLFNLGASISFSWDSDMVLVDSLWNISGIVDQEIIEEIPGVKVELPINTTLDDGVTKNITKFIYVDENYNQDLQIQVTGNNQESYNIKIAWKDFYFRTSSMIIEDWETDSFTVSKNILKIDFWSSKLSDYSVLLSNLTNQEEGIVYLDSLKSIDEPQLIEVNWKELRSISNSVSYSVDMDNDWEYELESNISPTPNQDQLLSTISWYVLWDKDISMSRWKVCIDENNNGTCEENIEKFVISDKTWYYEFEWLEKWSYKILMVPRKNWEIRNNSYTLDINNSQNITNLNFSNSFTKWKNKN